MVEFNPERRQFGLDDIEMSLAVSGMSALMGFGESPDEAEERRALVAAYQEALVRPPTNDLEVAFQTIQAAYTDEEHSWDLQGIGRKIFWLPDAIAPRAIDALHYSADHAEEDPLAEHDPNPRRVQMRREIAETAIRQLQTTLGISEEGRSS